MNDSAAKKVLFIKAIEEGDPAGEVLSKADRLVATQKTQSILQRVSDKQLNNRISKQSKEAFLTKRAELLFQIVGVVYPKARTDINRIQWSGWFTVLLLILLSVSGFIANEFESGKRLNLLAFPVIGMLGWNLFVYSLKVFTQVFFIFRKRYSGTNQGFFLILISNISIRLLKKKCTHSSDKTLVYNRCFRNYYIEWLKLSSSIYRIHVSRVFHLCAILFALGIIGGMYLRGLTTEYYAGWESTFLETETVHNFLSIALMPAAIITEQQFPTLERVASIRWGNGGLGENATDWIHLFAKTIFLFIIVPRCFLSVIAFIRERHLRTHFPIQYDKDSYFTKLFISKPGQRELMHIIPYSIELTDQQKDVLRSLFAQVLGWKAQVEFHRTISYGREDQFCREFTFSAKDPVESLAILFSLSSTPETEIHNAFISTLFKMVTDNNMVVQILIVVDESDFKTRFSRQKGAEEKLESRRELWRRTITSKNVKPVFVNLHNPDTNEWQNAINLT
ncbi:DUF2868 domain-containing protein [Candidatus Scalindua japonica]|nr:DUF2868 domain-containing protein [Candidatus Scalindua japonica]